MSKVTSVLGTRKLPHLTTCGIYARWKKDKLWEKLSKAKGLKHLQKRKGSLVLKQDRTMLWKDNEKKAHIAGKWRKLKKRAKERGSNRSLL